MHGRLIALMGTLFAGAPTIGFAQATEATDVTSADVQAVQNHPEGGIDRQIKVVDVGEENIAVGILHREALEATDGPLTGLVHHDITEVYYILSGSGTLVTGGTFIDSREFPSDSPVVTELVGPSSMGTSEGDHERVVSEGDTVIIPAGVFHAWKEIPDHVTYLDVRADPKKVLPSGYIHPALR